MPGFEYDDVVEALAPERDWLERTVPPFPDPDAEGTAAMWARLRAERDASQVEEDDSEYDVTITQAAEEFDEPISTLAAYLKLGNQHGWEILTLSHSKAFSKGKPFKSGANEGTSRPDQDIEAQWVHLRKDNDIVEIYVDIVNGVPRGASTVRRLNNQKMADRDLKNYIKGVHE
jgi:hypothetical protein